MAMYCRLGRSANPEVELEQNSVISDLWVTKQVSDTCEKQVQRTQQTGKLHMGEHWLRGKDCDKNRVFLSSENGPKPKSSRLKIALMSNMICKRLKSHTWRLNSVLYGTLSTLARSWLNTEPNPKAPLLAVKYNSIDVECPSVCCAYVFLPLANKEPWSIERQNRIRREN